jgi:hypothetical protein
MLEFAMGPWESILETAIYTPSPHNTQPWRLRIESDRRATLYLERGRMLPDEDASGQFLRCAMGMFLEAMTIIAANSGWRLTNQLSHPTGDRFIRFAELELDAAPPTSRFSSDLFRCRFTSRLGSNGTPIAPPIAAQLKAFEPQHGQQYHQIDEPGLIESIVQENITAVFHDLNSPAYHDEIVRWFRYSKREARSNHPLRSASGRRLELISVEERRRRAVRPSPASPSRTL